MSKSTSSQTLVEHNYKELAIYTTCCDSATTGTIQTGSKIYLNHGRRSLLARRPGPLLLIQQESCMTRKYWRWRKNMLQAWGQCDNHPKSHPKTRGKNPIRWAVLVTFATTCLHWRKVKSRALRLAGGAVLYKKKSNLEVSIVSTELHQNVTASRNYRTKNKAQRPSCRSVGGALLMLRR